MKKLYLIFILSIIFAGAYSQGDLDNAFYFRFGYSKPAQSYLGNDDADVWDEVKRNGLVFEVGKIYMLNSIPLADGLRLGINADFLSFYFHHFKAGDEKDRYFALGSKVGPSLSYSPVNKLVFDLYGKFNPVWVSARVFTFQSLDNEYEFNFGYLGLGYSFGINIRYSILLLGFDFNKSFNKLQHYDEVNGEFDGTYKGNVSNDNTDYSPMPSYNFSIGIAF